MSAVLLCSFLFVEGYQWRVQGFPGGGANLIFGKIFAKNYTKRNKLDRGGHASPSAPLDLPVGTVTGTLMGMLCLWHSNECTVFVAEYSNRYAVFVDGYASTAFGWISRLKDWEKRSFPVSLGKDFSGVVVQTGQGVTHVKPGDEVRSQALNVTLQIKISSYTLC